MYKICLILVSENMKKLFALFFTILFIFKVNMSEAAVLSVKEREALEKIFYYIKKDHFDQSAYEAKQSHNKYIQKIEKWLRYQSDYEGNKFQDMVDFMEENPAWPDIKTIRNRAEIGLPNNASSDQILQYFGKNEPITGNGMKAYADILLLSGNNNPKALELLKQAWKQGDFKQNIEDDFISNHGKKLSEDDHVGRASRLIWEEKLKDAKRMVGRLDKHFQHLFTARIYLIEDKKGVEQKVNSVPNNLQNDPGLLYDKARWSIKRKNYDRALSYIKLLGDNKEYADKWWKVRHRIVRELIEEKRYKEAYKVAKNHNTEEGTVEFADAEWLAGWLSLVFLNDSDEAYKHFYKMYQNVGYPISKSRGAYWAGKAAQINNNPTIAEEWYKIAAQYPTTFYGQMALFEIKKNPIPEFNPYPKIVRDELKKEQNDEMLKVAEILFENGDDKKAAKFIKAAIDNTDIPGEMAYISEFGARKNHLYFSVVAAKQASYKGVDLIKTGFPIINQMPKAYAEKNLVLGITRQESMFDSSAVSGANAMGFMQVLPSTAKLVSNKLGIRYKKDKLTEDGSYNIAIGSKYISDLINGFNGSYILAIASYNAGPNNARRWIRDYGDPREKKTAYEVVNWIESIPFSETRNYVQRVMENTQVYKNLLFNQPFSLEEDLLRNNGTVN